MVSRSVIQMPGGPLPPRPGPKDYKAEFGQLGVAQVRSELLARRWDKDKLSAARVWVENQDAQSWADSRSGKPARQGPKPFRKYAVWIAMIFGIAFGISRLAKMFF